MSIAKQVIWILLSRYILTPNPQRSLVAHEVNFCDFVESLVSA